MTARLVFRPDVLHGKVALVTGGGTGIGFGIARCLASAGADVLLTSRHEDEARATAQEIADGFGHRVVAVGADVTSPDDADRVAERAIAEFGKIDILINNARVNIRGPID